MGELSIKVTIAGRVYPITVQTDEEDRVRKAALAVDQNLKELQENFVVKDKQDLLAMTALQFSTRLLEIDGQNALKVAPEALDEMESLIDAML
jgi:cell division protein ZapA